MGYVFEIFVMTYLVSGQTMASDQTPRRIFASDTAPRRVTFPWRRTLAMCWANVRNRRGRFLLTLLGVAITVAFLMSSMTYHDILADLATRDDVHTKAVLERAGAFTGDQESLAKQGHQRLWILVLSAVLCLTGITNTMLMSVTERSGEIGTLKCLGALDGFVVRLFLLESLLVGVIGSLAGALTGYLLGMLQLGFGLEFSLLSLRHWVLPVMAAAPIAIGTGTVLTVISALYPTYVAAKMAPVEAMRVEI